MDIFRAFGHRAQAGVLAPGNVPVNDDCDQLLELMRTWDLTYAEALVELESRELNVQALAASAGWRARVASDAGATTGDVLAVGIACAAAVGAMAWLGQYLTVVT